MHSPELAAAIADAANTHEGPAYKRGLFAAGPQFVTPSDVLVKAMEQAQLSLSIHAAHYRADIVEERRAHRLTEGRRRQYAKHGRSEFLTAIR